MGVAKGRELQSRIESGQAVTAVIGLGYVGLPLAMCFAERGRSVVGLDIDTGKVDQLRAGQSYLRTIASARVASCLAERTLQVTTDFATLGQADAVIICVPTPLTPQREPDMRFVHQTCEGIVPHLRRDQLVVLESTTYPGTTDGLVADILGKSGLHAGEDFFLAFSPEREDPGNIRYGTHDIPKVVGGIDERSRDLAVALYNTALDATVPVSSTRVAETVKLTENIFRAVNIALVNELKVIYERMGVDIWEVLDACETKPFGFMRFNPGPGLGGHCIPLDPFYLTWKAREYGVSTRFIELAGEINVSMPAYVIQRLQGALNDRAKPIRNAKVLLVGLAYKKNIDDPRESPAFEILDQLLHLGARVSYHDPFISTLPSMRSWPELPEMRSVNLDADLLRSQDAVVVVTDHDKVDYALIREAAPLVVDTRGVYRQDLAKVVRA